MGLARRLRKLTFKKVAKAITIKRVATAAAIVAGVVLAPAVIGVVAKGVTLAGPVIAKGVTSLGVLGAAVAGSAKHVAVATGETAESLAQAGATVDASSGIVNAAAARVSGGSEPVSLAGIGGSPSTPSWIPAVAIGALLLLAFRSK